MFVLAHLSDPHLPAIPRPRLTELAGKRGLGLVNWSLRRRREHRFEVLDALTQDLAAQAPDHIAVTGDLVNVALPDEFASARKFLESLGPPERVSFVPGNHDAYVRAALEHSHAHWRHYLTGDHAEENAATVFPYVRRRGPVALVCASTALPTGPFMATGRLGVAQVERIEEALARLADEQLFRVVLMHHPPRPLPRDRLKRLIDAAALREVLSRCGAELVLFGHIHVSSLAWLDGPGGHTVPAVSVPSASATPHGEESAAYHLFRIEGGGAAWRCEMVTRGFGADGGGIGELRRRVLHPRGDQ